MIFNATAGLTIYLRAAAPRSAIHFPHNRLGLTMPGVSISEKVMFVRLLNHDNDSGAIGAGYAWDGKDVAWTELLADRLRIDLAALDRGARGLGSTGADRPRRGQ